MNQTIQQWDVLIVGGGPAGLSAALLLGRARKRVLVCDSGEPRNAPSPEVHNFLSQDGIEPAALLRIGREQLSRYDGVEHRVGKVTEVERQAGGFLINLGDDTQVFARKVLLATGVVDELPPIEGIRELWGKSVLHCPYCHGWEVRDQPLAIYGNGDGGFDLARLISGWSQDIVLCTDGPAELTTEQRNQLDANGIGVREEKIARLEGSNGTLETIVFENGSALARHALYVRPKQRQRSDLAERLGCAFTPHGQVVVDEMGRTSVPGLFVAGDATTLMQQVVTAAAGGAKAGGMMNHELVVEDFEARCR